MKDDIKAAKAITKAILAEERDETVDFILSTFSDPGIVAFRRSSTLSDLPIEQLDSKVATKSLFSAE